MLSKINKGFALSLVTHQSQLKSSFGLVETLTGEFKRKNLCQIQKCICFTFLTFRVYLLPPQNEIQLLPRFIFYSKLVWPGKLDIKFSCARNKCLFPLLYFP